MLTSVVDEQFRSRVYALGVDLYWQKPASQEEINLFRECIESLLDRDATAGFRGVQSKSLMDIVQLECIAHSSSVLRITNGPLSGRIWINNGELVDAETDGARGEEAFRKILSWRTGSFETLPAEPSRAQTIFKSYNALLLETAQAVDFLAKNADPVRTAEHDELRLMLFEVASGRIGPDEAHRRIQSWVFEVASQSQEAQIPNQLQTV